MDLRKEQTPLEPQPIKNVVVSDRLRLRLGRSTRYIVEGVCGDTGATHGDNQWRTRPKKSLGARLCAGAADPGRGGDDETTC